MAKGKYVLVETLSFIVSMVTYALVFFLIFNTDLPGYYLLCVLHSVFVVIYTLLIFYFSRGLDFEKGSPMQTVNQFAKTNRNVSLVFTINNRLDEIAASNILSANPLGLFAKFKEMALGFGVITSKVITKPWFYVACNSSMEQIKKYYLRAFVLFCLSFLFVYPVCIFMITQLIGIMGENWVVLLLYDDYILIFLFVYFLCEFSRSTLLACDGEDFLFKVEKIFFFIRASIFSLFLLSSYVGIFEIEIITFIIIELLLRILFLILENMKIFTLFQKRRI